MTQEEILQQFNTAVHDSKLLPSKPDNNTLLELYSLYKQATEGDAPEQGGVWPIRFRSKSKA